MSHFNVKRTQKSLLIRVVLGSVLGGLSAAVAIVFILSALQSRAGAGSPADMPIVTVESEFSSPLHTFSFAHPSSWRVTDTRPQKYTSGTLRFATECTFYLENTQNNAQILIIDKLDGIDAASACFRVGDFSNTNTRTVRLAQQEQKILSTRWKDPSSIFWNKDIVDEYVLLEESGANDTASTYVVALFTQEPELAAAREVYDAFLTSLSIAQ